MSKAVEINWSHRRPRAELRRPSDGGTPALPEAVEAEPFQDAKTGRITDGKRAAKRSAERRRQLREIRANGPVVATLNPAACDPWLKPHVVDGATYAMDLLGRFPDPALSRLVGATVDAHVVSKALMALAAKGDARALSEARGWLREHRACLRELSALAGIVGGAGDDAIPPGWEEDGS